MPPATRPTPAPKPADPAPDPGPPVAPKFDAGPDPGPPPANPVVVVHVEKMRARAEAVAKDARPAGLPDADLSAFFGRGYTGDATDVTSIEPNVCSNHPDATHFCALCGLVHRKGDCVKQPRRASSTRTIMCGICSGVHREHIACPRPGQCLTCGRPPHDGECPPT